MQDDSLWACLAGMAAAHKELSTAEIAYAAIDEVNIDGILRCNIVIRQYYYVAILSYVNIITCIRYSLPAIAVVHFLLC